MPPGAGSPLGATVFGYRHVFDLLTIVADTVFSSAVRVTVDR